MWKDMIELVNTWARGWFQETSLWRLAKKKKHLGLNKLEINSPLPSCLSGCMPKQKKVHWVMNGSRRSVYSGTIRLFDCRSLGSPPSCKPGLELIDQTFTSLLSSEQGGDFRAVEHYQHFIGWVFLLHVHGKICALTFRKWRMYVFSSQ